MSEALSPALAWLRRHETKARFLVAGGVNTVFGLATFPTLMWTLGRRGMHYMVALIISQILNITFAYFTQKMLVFRTKGNYVAEMGKFSLFYLSYFAVNLVALPFLVEIVRLDPVIAQSSLAITVIATSYFWHSRVTFRPRGPVS